MNQKCKASGSLGKQKSGEAEVKEKGAGRRREGEPAMVPEVFELFP